MVKLKAVQSATDADVLILMYKELVEKELFLQAKAHSIDSHIANINSDTIQIKCDTDTSKNNMNEIVNKTHKISNLKIQLLKKQNDINKQRDIDKIDASNLLQSMQQQLSKKSKLLNIRLKSTDKERQEIIMEEERLNIETVRTQEALLENQKRCEAIANESSMVLQAHTDGKQMLDELIRKKDEVCENYLLSHEDYMQKLQGSRARQSKLLREIEVYAKQFKEISEHIDERSRMLVSKKDSIKSLADQFKQLETGCTASEIFLNQSIQQKNSIAATVESLQMEVNRYMKKIDALKALSNSLESS